MHRTASKYATILDIMVVALDPTSKTTYDLVSFSQGRTFNDGGTTYSGVFKTYENGDKYYRATIPSDYRLDVVDVTKVIPKPRSHIDYT